MTDNKFNELLSKLASANKKYKYILDLAEKEYENRYGNNPENNDLWVDSFHVGTGELTLTELDKSAQF